MQTNDPINFRFRKATTADAPRIWQILQQAIERRKRDGSDQWQDGYPNPEIVRQDLQRQCGFVWTADDGQVAAYAALLINDEPAYDDIDGSWLTNGDFVVVHRIAVADGQLGKGLGRLVLQDAQRFAAANGISSVKIDTNHDNVAMLRNLGREGFTYCGEVVMGTGVRKAFEKTASR